MFSCSFHTFHSVLESILDSDWLEYFKRLLSTHNVGFYIAQALSALLWSDTLFFRPIKKGNENAMNVAMKRGVMSGADLYLR